MANNVLPGYGGMLYFTDSLSGIYSIRVPSFSINMDQKPLFYDHTIGLLDTIPTGPGSKSEGSSIQFQKVLYRPGVKMASGSFTFPATENNYWLFFEEAKKGTKFNLSFRYACNNAGRNFFNCRIASYKFSVSAREILNITIDIMAEKMDSEDVAYSSDWVPEKLVTWDKCIAECPALDSDRKIISFDLSVNNPLIPIYTNTSNARTGDDALWPKEIRIGMQEVQGTISVYNKTADILNVGSSSTIITFGLRDLWEKEVTAILLPTSATGDVKPVTQVFGFYGVDKALGE